MTSRFPRGRSPGRRPAFSDAYELPVAGLRGAATGRWNAKRIAEALGVPLPALARATGETYRTVARHPESARLQNTLAAIANVVGVLCATFAGDTAAVRAWLREPQPALGDLTPLEAMLQPGRAPAVEQWLTRLWLGEPV